MGNVNKLFFHLLVLFVVSCTAAIEASAATFNVNSTLDTSDANTADNSCADVNNVCTLRAAVEQANASPGADSITFDAAAFAGSKTIALGSELAISGDLTVTGTTPARLTLIGSGASRAFNVTANFTVGISNLTVANCFSSGDGGGIINNGGTLTLTALVITDNVASGNGGGVATVGGTLNVINSTVGGTANPALQSNSAASGGGIYNTNGTVNLTNSTVTNNIATGSFGGGYYGFTSVGATTLNAADATFIDNRALNGDSVAISAAVGFSTVNVNNTIAGDRAASGSGADFFVGAGGVLASGGYNLIENATGATFAGTGDQTGVDPSVGALADNGGLTPTHALLAGSRAIDKGNSTVSGQTTDQRGFARPVDLAPAPATGGNNADIGAFEVQPAAPTAALVTVGGRVVNLAGRPIARTRVTMTDLNGETRYALTNTFGYYRFSKVAAGETYVFSASAKRYEFAPRVLTVNEETSELNFTGAN